MPGAIGTPMAAIVHGGESITPAGAGMASSKVDIHIGNYMGDDVSLRQFAKTLKAIVGEDNRRNSFGLVSKGYYFGRSSV